jgi:hypothetical protein
VVVARSAWEIHDTRLLSDPSALPSCTSLGVWLAWYRADGHPLPGRAPRCRAGQSSTMRHTERSTHTAILSNRSRSVNTFA